MIVKYKLALEIITPLNECTRRLSIGVWFFLSFFMLLLFVFFFLTSSVCFENVFVTPLSEETQTNVMEAMNGMNLLVISMTS